MVKIRCGTQEACDGCPFEDYNDPNRAQQLGGVAWVAVKLEEIHDSIDTGRLEKLQKLSESKKTNATGVELLDIGEAVKKYKNGNCNLERNKLNGKDF
ncbi:MAG: hypothetical protein U0451_03255 [Candidatus Saccharimonadales bacterium]